LNVVKRPRQDFPGTIVHFEVVSQYTAMHFNAGDVHLC